MRRFAMAGLLVSIVLVVAAGAQTKPPATFADYGQFETLASTGSRGGLAPDGRVLVYGINRSNRNNELRITRLSDAKTTIAAFGSQPVYSADSKWLAYAIGQSEAEQEKLRNEKKPIQNKLGLVNLGTFEVSTFDGVESFAFSPDGAYLAMRRYAPERPGASAATSPSPGGGGRGGAGAADPAEDAPGATLIVRHVASGRDTTFGNIATFAWQDVEKTHLLAMIISAEGKIGNGVQLFDPDTTALRMLDSSASSYADLAWRKDGPDLAVFRAKTDDKHDGSTFAVLTWRGLGRSETARVYDPTADSSFPAGMRTVSFRRLSWSDDGSSVFLGTATWDLKPPPAGRGEKPGGPAAGADQGAPRDKEPPAVADEPASVEIWHYADVSVMPRQKVSAASDRRRNNLAVLNLDAGKLTPLGKDAVNEQVTPVRRTGLAYVAEWSKYAMNRTIGRPSSDIYLVNAATGERTPLKSDINDRFVQAGPGGKFLLFLQDDNYWTINIATRTVTNITNKVATSFINKESDETIVQKPPFGVAGWTKDDAAVLLYDKFDLWEVAADGTKARRLTNGAAEQVRHRLVRLDPEEEWIDLSKPTYVSLFGERSKKSGYGRLTSTGAAERLVWDDRFVSGLAKAKAAGVFAFTSQDYDDSPDVFVGGADLKDAKQVTATNPFQSKFAWGRSELLEYKTDKGKVLQGALYYPAGYEAGKTYPMVVYMYELLSQNVHRYVAPSDRDYYNTSVFTSQGYFVFQPDIVFTPRQPGVSVVQCVTAGVKKVIQMGVADPKRVGVVGHSMGGFDAAYLATHTNGIFAAAVAGAPITDLVSYYGDHHWSSGIAETDHIETGQERMEVALYEDFKAYVDNSAVFNVHNMTVPLLLEAGDSDGTVAWHQSIELYNVARRAKKNVVMAAYIGEDHGLRQKKNQVDYQRRILAWFGHYLKGAPAESWITAGQSFLDRDAEVKRLTPKK
jgi:dipeptidyl aminopeptidase/acylaminoacyl peptidase